MMAGPIGAEADSAVAIAQQYLMERAMARISSIHKGNFFSSENRHEAAYRTRHSDLNPCGSRWNRSGNWNGSTFERREGQSDINDAAGGDQPSRLMGRLLVSARSLKSRRAVRCPPFLSQDSIMLVV
jgi:hypothetical protein